MESGNNLDVFLRPASVAVIGASERKGSWGSFIMEGLRSWNYPGKIYPVNQKMKEVFGIPAFSDIRDIPNSIDLAIVTIPEQSTEKVVASCGKKRVKGITLITAGFSEVMEEGRQRERALKDLAHSYGMRLLGPNVSGTFNIHAQFNAAASPADHIIPTTIAAVTQGGYAFYDLLASGFPRGMGVGQFIHTGNECDLTITDFLEYFGHKPDVHAVIMYIETIRDGTRFIDVARTTATTKPVVVYKAGNTPGGFRAAQSHTGALAGRAEIFSGFLKQAGVIVSPTMELLLPLGHALVERPPMRGNRVAIITMGGSWGVALSDALEKEGLQLPELSTDVQNKLRSLGMPSRASTKNPVDIGASGLFISIEAIVAIGRAVLTSGEVDALILHGIGRPGMLGGNVPVEIRLMPPELDRGIMKGYAHLESETGIPVVIGNLFTPWESQAVHDVNEEGIRVVNRVDETAQLLSLMHEYWNIKRTLR